MRNKSPKIICASLFLCAPPAISSMCYTVIKNNTTIYQSQIPPIDMSDSISQEISTKFGPDAFMIFSEKASCIEQLEPIAPKKENKLSPQLNAPKIPTSSSPSEVRPYTEYLDETPQNIDQLPTSVPAGKFANRSTSTATKNNSTYIDNSSKKYYITSKKYYTTINNSTKSYSKSKR